MKLRTLILCLSTLHAGFALASPAEYVFVPAVEYGEKEIDLKFGTAKPDGEKREQAVSIGFGYSVTENWFTEIYLIREREGSEGTTLAEWENKFQLTETGKYPVDVGFITEIEATRTGTENYELKIGPLFQTEFGKVQLNGNLLFTRQFGPHDSDEPQNTEFGYQWQVKYRWQPAFEFGLQGMGDVGKWNDWDTSKEQNHRMGPAVFGKIPVVGKQAIRYNAALLFGTSEAAADHTFRMQVEYEF